MCARELEKFREIRFWEETMNKQTELLLAVHDAAGNMTSKPMGTGALIDDAENWDSTNTRLLNL